MVNRAVFFVGKVAIVVAVAAACFLGEQEWSWKAVIREFKEAC
jgi:hypothetical protein